MPPAIAISRVRRISAWQFWRSESTVPLPSSPDKRPKRRVVRHKLTRTRRTDQSTYSAWQVVAEAALDSIVLEASFQLYPIEIISPVLNTAENFDDDIKAAIRPTTRGRRRGRRKRRIRRPSRISRTGRRRRRGEVPSRTSRGRPTLYC
jgi:hypothetical protein